MAAEDPPQLVFRETSTGVKIAEIALGSGADNAVGPASKVTFHMVGRLAGRQGWVFENSQLEDDPYRLDLSQRGAVVAGLVEGLQGMRVGGKRRIIVPSAEGYVNREVEPVPRDFGSRNRLYSTVLNSNRKDQERKALGADLAGVVVFDVAMLRIR
jgi:FKBP-type peptidyl-prolyl cis-trans isomerase FkpA